MGLWLVRHDNLTLADEGESLLLRSLLGAGGLEHSNRNVLFLPAAWVDAGLPPSYPVVYQQDRLTHFSETYRERVITWLRPDDPGRTLARLAGLIGQTLPAAAPASPLPMRVTDEDDGAPLARLGIPDRGALAEITVCGASVEVALTRGAEVRLAKDALVFALPVLTDPLRLVRLVRTGQDLSVSYDRTLLRQIDYIAATGERAPLAP
jgi:hypothetical protein